MFSFWCVGYHTCHVLSAILRGRGPCCRWEDEPILSLIISYLFFISWRLIIMIIVSMSENVCYTWMSSARISSSCILPMFANVFFQFLPMLANVDQYFSILANVCHCFPMLANVFQCLLMFATVYQCLAMFFNSCQCLPLFSNVSQCFSILANVCHCLPMFANV